MTEGYTGHPDGLLAATRTLLEWADGQGRRTGAGVGRHFYSRWRPVGARLEIYKTDGPDMSKWETELAFRLAGN